MKVLWTNVRARNGISNQRSGMEFTKHFRSSNSSRSWTSKLSVSIFKNNLCALRTCIQCMNDPWILWSTNERTQVHSAQWTCVRSLVPTLWMYVTQTTVIILTSTSPWRPQTQTFVCIIFVALLRSVAAAIHCSGDNDLFNSDSNQLPVGRIIIMNNRSDSRLPTNTSPWRPQTSYHCVA